jgi:hypothetical protein
MMPSQYTTSGDYVAVPKGSPEKFAGMRTVNTMLQSMEKVIERRPDLFPVLGDDILENGRKLSAARLKWQALTRDWSFLKDADPTTEIGEFISNLAAIPRLVRGFGEVGNLAKDEQAIAREAAGLNGPSGAQTAQAKINNIRRMLNDGLAGHGLQPFIRATKPGAGGEVISRGSSLYKEAKRKGFTDEQMQQHGVRVVD